MRHLTIILIVVGLFLYTPCIPQAEVESSSTNAVIFYVSSFWRG